MGIIIAYLALIWVTVGGLFGWAFWVSKRVIKLERDVYGLGQEILITNREVEDVRESGNLVAEVVFNREIGDDVIIDSDDDIEDISWEEIQETMEILERDEDIDSEEYWSKMAEAETVMEQAIGYFDDIDAELNRKKV